MISLKPGDMGDEVFRLQSRLVAHGHFCSIDGHYGLKTTAAVRAFQRAAGLDDDGLAGPLTLAKLESLVARVVPKQGDTVFVGELELPAVRCWPLRALADGRLPIITSGHKSRNGGRPNHNGIDLLYRYLPADPPTKIGDGGRTKGYWIPEETWSIAPADGIVEVAGNSPTGFRVWIRHAGGLLTGGFHYDQIAVLVGQPVKMGGLVGRVNDNPRDSDPDHLHWEVSSGDVSKDKLSIVGYPAGTLDPQDTWLGGAQVLAAG